jgi:plastocyanin
MTDRAPRQSLLLPLLIPLGSLAVIGLALWGFSRILLNTTHVAATTVAVVAAAGVLAVAAYVAARKNPGNAALFSMLGGAAGIAMLAGGVALVAAPPHGEEEEGGPAVVIVAPPNAAAEGFAEDAYAAPADIPFEIEFDNQDPGVPHNVFVAEEEGGTNLLEGTTINGPAVTTYAVEEPLAEGDYFFFCSVHPTTMTGTMTAAAGGGGEGGGDGGEGGGEGDGGGGITVVAEELAFSPTEVEVPADTPTTITLDNRDDVGTFGPHNLAVYQDDSYAAQIAATELINGPATGTVDLPALAEGTYPFRCDVHPQMVGTVTAVAGGGGTGDAPADDAGDQEAEPPPSDDGG